MKKLSNEFMEKVLNDSAWKELAGNFQWTEQMLEKHKTKVDWKEISKNSNIVWTPAMLDKFRKCIDWKVLSNTGCETILTEETQEQFKVYQETVTSIWTTRWLIDSLTYGIGQSLLTVGARKNFTL